jgi:membrane protein DedA with SNARE-associated domain
MMEPVMHINSKLEKTCFMLIATFIYTFYACLWLTINVDGEPLLPIVGIVGGCSYAIACGCAGQCETHMVYNEAQVNY